MLPSIRGQSPNVLRIFFLIPSFLLFHTVVYGVCRTLNEITLSLEVAYYWLRGWT